MVISAGRFATVAGSNFVPDFGNGSLGNVTISTVVEASGRLNYADLTITATGTLVATARRRIEVLATGNISVASGGKISATGRGNAGTDGGAGASGWGSVTGGTREVGVDGVAATGQALRCSASGAGGEGGVGGHYGFTAVYFSAPSGVGGSGGGRFNVDDGAGVSTNTTAFATATLRCTANFLNNENISIVEVGNSIPKAYTFETVLTNTDGHVLIGATLFDSLSNLAAAINLGVGSGFLYASATTIHQDVTVLVAPEPGSAELTVTSKFPGVGNNSALVSAAGATSATWTTATLTGGVGGGTGPDIDGLDGAVGQSPTAIAAELKAALSSATFGSRHSFLGGAGGAGGGGGSGGGAGGSWAGLTGAGGAGGVFSAGSQSGAGVGTGTAGANSADVNSVPGGGGGGSGGAGGGMLEIWCGGDITLTGGALIEADGGAGGAGGNTGTTGSPGPRALGGGGGGGSGGGGGQVLVVHRGVATGLSVGGSVRALGGAGGAGGNGDFVFYHGGDGGAGPAGEDGFVVVAAI